MNVIGTVKNGVIELPPDARLEEGQRFEVRALSVSRQDAFVLRESVMAAPPVRDLPDDLAPNLDYYPQRNLRLHLKAIARRLYSYCPAIAQLLQSSAKALHKLLQGSTRPVRPPGRFTGRGDRPFGRSGKKAARGHPGCSPG